MRKQSVFTLLQIFLDWHRDNAGQRFGQYWWNLCGLTVTGLDSWPELFYCQNTQEAHHLIASNYVDWNLDE